jgi:hypothetical protein
LYAKPSPDDASFAVVVASVALVLFESRSSFIVAVAAAAIGGEVSVEN